MESSKKINGLRLVFEKNIIDSEENLQKVEKALQDSKEGQKINVVISKNTVEIYNFTTSIRNETINKIITILGLKPIKGIILIQNGEKNLTQFLDEMDVGKSY